MARAAMGWRAAVNLLKLGARQLGTEFDMAWRVGVDIGGTFTDVALVDEASGAIGVAKVPTTPRNLAEGVLAGLCQRHAALRREAGRGGAAVACHHRRHQRHPARARRPRRARHHARLPRRAGAAALGPRRPLRPVPGRARPCSIPRRRRFEITERIGADGQVVTPLAEAEIDGADRGDRRPRASRPSPSRLLFSFLNPEHERRLGAAPARRAARRPRLPVLRGAAGDQGVRAHQHDGGVRLRRADPRLLPRAAWRRRPRAPGPAAALRDGLQRRHPRSRRGRGACRRWRWSRARPPAWWRPRWSARQTGRGNLLSFDMGGTTAKASLIRDGQYETTPEYEVGGGSSAQPLDARHRPSDPRAGDRPGRGVAPAAARSPGSTGPASLRVGPKSAGADPGPVCYGRGGTEPTVTDCDLLLGYLDKGSLLAGDLPIDHAARAKPPSRKQLGRAARRRRAHGGRRRHRRRQPRHGARRCKIVSVQRGHDPREFVLAAFGGAGPLHAAALADELGIAEVRRVRRSPAPSRRSAWSAPTSSATTCAPSTPPPRAPIPPSVEAAFAALETEGAAMLDRAGVAPAQRRFERSVDARYERQSYELSVPVPPRALDAASARRDRRGLPRPPSRHLRPRQPRRAGAARQRAPRRHRRDRAADWCATAPRQPERDADQEPRARCGSAQTGRSRGHRLRPRGACRPGSRRRARPIIESLESTILVPPGWQARMTDDGFVVLARSSPCSPLAGRGTARAQRPIPPPSRSSRTASTRSPRRCGSSSPRPPTRRC